MTQSFFATSMAPHPTDNGQTVYLCVGSGGRGLVMCCIRTCLGKGQNYMQSRWSISLEGDIYLRMSRNARLLLPQDIEISAEMVTCKDIINLLLTYRMTYQRLRHQSLGRGQHRDAPSRVARTT